MMFSPPTRTALICAALLLASAAISQAGDASLSWEAPTTTTDGSPASNIRGYKVYVGTSSGKYTQKIDASSTSSTITNLTEGTTYYFAVTAVDSTGIESDFSNEVSKRIVAAAPPPAPAPEPPVTGSVVKGDVDGDSTVSLADVLAALRIAANPGTASAAQKASADVYPLDAQRQPRGDGNVAVDDVLAILRRVVQPGTW